MSCFPVKFPVSGVVCVDESPTYRIKVRERIYEFEWHHYCGPNVVTKTGAIAASQPRAFLDAAQLWDEQGRQVDADGLCVWTIPDPFGGQQVVHLAGRHFLVVPEGRDPQEYKREQLAQLGLDADLYTED